MKNKRFFILIGAILGLILLICNLPGTYCKDYYAVVNQADNKSYRKIINDNGPIKKIEIIENIEYVSYEDGRTFVFEILSSGMRYLRRIDITSEQYRFGKKQIGVGTTRKQIESIYKCGKNRYYPEDDKIEVVESDTSICFYFNDQNVVYEMYVGKPDVYE